MPKSIIVILISSAAILFNSCSASTDSRYSKEAETEIPSITKNETFTEDDFDLTPFETKLIVPYSNEKELTQPQDLWFDYPENDSTSENTEIASDTISGYRVQVISTDNLDEANGVRSEIYFKTNEKKVYVIFEPPFYVVRVGNFRNIEDAEALNFKLQQIGFTGTKVVNDQITVSK